MIDARENAKWTVYLHIVPKAISGYDYDKYYVGITSQKPERRWGKDGHIYKNQGESSFRNAIKKYGWENIEHEIISSSLTEGEAKNMEKCLIKLLKAHGKYGYNLTDGGDGTTGTIPESAQPIYVFNVEGKFIDWFRSFRFIRDTYGISESRIKTAVKSRRQIEEWFFASESDVVYNPASGVYELRDYSSFKRDSFIYQFDFEGNYIARFRSCKEAALKSHCGVQEIYGQISKKNDASYQSAYIWKSDFEVEQIEGTFKIVDFVPPPVMVYQFDFNGNYMCKYNNATEASQILGIDKVTIWKHLTGQIKRYGLNKDSMYTWRYLKDVHIKDGVFSIPPIKPYYCHDKVEKKPHLTKVYQFDPMGNFINLYPSILSASEATGVTPITIRNYFNHKRTITYKTEFLWETEENVLKVGKNFYLKSLPKDNIRWIYRFNIEGGFTGKYKSTREAERLTNESHNNIEYKIKNHCRIDNKFHSIWATKEEVEYFEGVYYLKDYLQNKIACKRRIN